MRLLLHICCGPCSILPLRDLLGQGVEVTGLYYNPNIHPLTEYARRRDGCLQVARDLGVTVIVKDNEYDPQAWLRRVAFREENRCLLCHQMRLERTLNIARNGHFDAFSSTLLYSRFQKHEQIRDLGRDLAAGGATRFYYQDWRKDWDEGVQSSRQMGVYRQQYCGCIYSEVERFRRECLPSKASGGTPEGETRP